MIAFCFFIIKIIKRTISAVFKIRLTVLLLCYEEIIEINPIVLKKEATFATYETNSSRGSSIPRFDTSLNVKLTNTLAPRASLALRQSPNGEDRQITLEICTWKSKGCLFYQHLV